MKNTYKFIIIITTAATLLIVQAGCDRLGSGTEGGNENPLRIEESETVFINMNPIASVYTLSENDIEAVSFTGSRYRERWFSFERQEQYTYLLNDLKRLELLEPAENFNVVTAGASLIYEIQLKKADSIFLNFYDNVVDFGDGFYYYTDADNSIFPEKVSYFNIGIAEFEQSWTYEDSGDIESLRSIIERAAIISNTAVQIDYTGDSISVVAGDPVTGYARLYIKEDKNTFLLYKSFFASYILIGEISAESYNSLIFACKGQFGTREHLSVTSGGITIHPLRHFLHGLSFDAETGQGMAADGFPYLDQWRDKLESVYYGKDFSISIKTENAVSRLYLEGEFSDISYADIEALPAGEYIITCEVTVQGDFVEKANDYNSSTYVYWFKLIKT